MVGCVVVALALCAKTALAQGAQGADDDWEIVDQTVATPQPTPDRAAILERLTIQAQAPNGVPPGSFLACHQLVLPAEEPYTSIVALLNQMWGTRATVYQTLRRSGPHACPETYIFYNPENIKEVSRRMGIKDKEQERAMLYVIFAHEIGHLIHHDGTRQRAAVPRQIWEHEADRFAGYTFYRLNMKRFDTAEIEFYLQAIGDDFWGARNGWHGTGQQRVAAFQQGWDLARSGKSEDSPPPAISGLE